LRGKKSASRAREAVRDLERALEILAGKEGDPNQVAEAKFHLADALWRAGLDRDRARSLATESEAIYVEQGPGSQRALDAVQAWRAERG
jgi:eukaryotic-like serine/threonine-protein kinase